MSTNIRFRKPRTASSHAPLLWAAGLLACLALPGVAEAQVRTWTVTSGLWQTPGNWSASTVPTSATTAAFSSASNETSSLNADAAVAGLTFSNAGTKSITSDSATARALTIGTTGVTINAGAGAVTLGNAGSPLNVALSGAQSWTNNAAPANRFTMLGGITSSAASGTQTLTVTGTGATLFSGNLANGSGGGTLALVKNGNGTLTLSGNNTYTGTTTSSAGMLALTQRQSLYGANTANWTSSLLRITGGTLGLNMGGTGEFTDSDVQTLTTGSMFSGGASTWLALDTSNATGPVTFSGNVNNTNAGTNISFAKLGAGTLIVAGTIGTTSSSRTVASGTLQIGTATTAGSIGSVNTLNNGTIVFEAQQSGMGVTISGTGQVIKKGNTLLNISSDQTYTGLTTIESGTLRLSDGAAANGWLAGDVSNSGVLIIRRNATKEFVGNISGAGSVITEAPLGGNIVFTGSSSYTGGTTIQGGRLTIGNGGTTGSIVGNVVNSGTLGFNRSDAISFSGTISGGGSLLKEGAGTLTLGGTNTYTGATTINAGMLQFGRASALYNATTASWTATNLRTGSGATLAFNVGGTGEFTTGNVTTLLTNLAASSSGTNGMNAGSFLGFDTTNASGGTFTIANAIADTTGASGGTRGLRKLGTDTLLLTAANSFTGAASVEGGTLAFDRVTALNSASGIGINAGTALDYTGAAGTLSRNITVATNGIGTIRNSGGQTLTLSGTLTKDGRVLRLTGGQFDVTGQIVGSSPNSDLFVDGATVTLSNANPYNGPTYVYGGGSLVLGITNAIPTNSALTLGGTGSDTGTGTLNTGTFTNTLASLTTSSLGGNVAITGSGATIGGLTTTGNLTFGAGTDTLSLSLTNPTLGRYTLVTYQGTRSGTFDTVTGNGNYNVVYGGASNSTIDLQHKATIGTITATPASATIIVGGTTAFGFTVQNSAPALGADLLATVTTGSNVVGSATPGAVAAGATSDSVSGLSFTSNTVGLGQTGLFTLTDAAATNSPQQGSVTVNVLNHSLASFAATDTATKTLNFGTYQDGAWTGGDGGNGTLAYSIFNIASLGFTDAQTAGLDLYDWVFSSGDDVFSLGYSPFTNLASGTSNAFTASVLSPGSLVDGLYTGTYLLKFRDQQNLAGATNTRDLEITLSANVIVVPEPGALALAGIGIAAVAYALRSRSPSRKRVG